MKIHVLQHVPFEDEAEIGRWAKSKGHALSKTHLYDGESFPSVEDFDFLVVMGGPMNIYEETKYSWLIGEKRFIEKAVGAGKKVLGVCLGAQLIADVLGAKIYKNGVKEIGWFPVELRPEAKESSLFSGCPEGFTPFHWHGDAFDLPPGAVHIAKSEGGVNQAFEYDRRVVGLQFHLESTQESVGRLIEHCGDEIVEGEFIQTGQEMLAERVGMEEAGSVLTILLDNFEKG